MAKNLEIKKELVKTTAQAISEVHGDKPNAFVLDFSKITANEINELRSKLFDQGAKIKVIKNTLILKVLQTVGVDIDKKLTGQNAMLIVGEDFITPLKEVFDFIKASDKGAVKFGVLDGKILSEEDVKALSKLPSRDQLLGQVVGTMLAPIRGFAYTLNGVQSNFARVLAAVRDSKS